MNPRPRLAPPVPSTVTADTILNESRGAIIASTGSKQFGRSWSGPPNPKDRPGQKPVAKPPAVIEHEPRSFTVDDPRLDDLAVKIKSAHNTFMRVTFESAVAAGAALLEAKEIVGHGKFMGWVSANCQIGHREVTRYIAVYEHREEIAAKLDTVANFGLRAFLKAIEKPAAPAPTDTRPTAPTPNRDESEERVKTLVAALHNAEPFERAKAQAQFDLAHVPAGRAAVDPADKAETTTAAPEQHQAATGDDLFARRDRQLAELDAAWGRADSAVRQTFHRRINAERAMADA